jgi:lipoate-protein ligase A
LVPATVIKALRAIFDPPALGPWNMAVDEALLETAAASGQPTLRFYQWQEPTLSLGYFQVLDDRQRHTSSQHCPVVRRASGGGAILHDRELTYSVAVPQTVAQVSGARRLYEICHQTLIAALAEVGVSAALYRDCSAQQADAELPTDAPFLCFQRRTCFDVVVGDAKIAGSAQRRRRGAVLQHGSILLARSPLAPELPGVQEAANIDIITADLIHRWTPHLAHALNLPIKPGSLTAAERSLIEVLSLRRFAALDRLARR